MARWRCWALIAGFAAVGCLRAQAAPVVLELFTSQSCSSCPPADALLAELAPRPGLLALDFHVDYWNGSGWDDPYSQAAFTERQKWYGQRLGQDGVYTPELVVAGRQGVVGSDLDAVAAAISAAPHAVVEVRLSKAAGGLAASVDAGAGSGTIWLVGFDPWHQTRVRGGENGGRLLMEANVVRSMTAVGRWNGAARYFQVSLPVGERAALLVQASDGQILGAGVLAAAGS